MDGTSGESGFSLLPTPREGPEQVLRTLWGVFHPRETLAPSCQGPSLRCSLSSRTEGLAVGEKEEAGTLYDPSQSPACKHQLYFNITHTMTLQPLNTRGNRGTERACDFPTTTQLVRTVRIQR